MQSFIFGMVCIIAGYGLQIFIILRDLNYMQKKRHLFKSELERYIKNLQTLSDEADIEYHLKQLKSFDDLRRNNKRIEDAISVYEWT